jgi:uncharacterized protein
MPKIHRQHAGELLVQAQRHVPTELSHIIEDLITTEIPAQHSAFFSNLDYFAICTTDHLGRPWGTLLVRGETTLISIPHRDKNSLEIRTKLSPDDPFYRCLLQHQTDQPDGGRRRSAARRCFAGVGVDFRNRRRNKIAGEIVSSLCQADGRILLKLLANENLGNCPKYITVRELVPCSSPRVPITVLDHMSSSPQGGPPPPLLLESYRHIINQASTVFISTIHTSRSDESPSDTDMGLNHRGGNPGFIRCYQTDEATYLCLPDYSGNRFYQSLGNVQSDSLIGLTIPCFASGDVLMVSGEGENLYDDEASAVMPRVTLLTRIRVTGFVLIEQGVGLTQISPDSLSPYNPPVRFLASELSSHGHNQGPVPFNDEDIEATLADVAPVTDDIATFVFRLSSPIQCTPGSSIILDFSEDLSTGYSHMNDRNPRSVNEDYTRTWTISSTSTPLSSDGYQLEPSSSVSVTVKRLAGGLMSNLLHRSASAYYKTTRLPRLSARVKGIGPGFSCFSPHGPPPSQMLWIAGGVGITPFMAMWSALLTRSQATPIDLAIIFSCRGAQEAEIVKGWIRESEAHSSRLLLSHVSFFDSTFLRSSSTNQSTSHNRRCQQSDLLSVPSLGDRVVFLCGPGALMVSMNAWLEDSGVPSENIVQESFLF